MPPAPPTPGNPPAPSASTTVVGVMGSPVAHSLSPLLHNTAFKVLGLDWVSVGFPVPEGSAAEALVGIRALGIRGMSVTMPHKATVAALVDRRTPAAERLGAVNCVTNEGGVLVGDNTDGEGFVASLRRGGAFDPDGRRCLVVGAGGAARAVIASLGDAGAREVLVVNRTRERGEAAATLAGRAGRTGEAGEAGTCDLVVNATPVGMGTEGGQPLDPGLLGPGQLAVDLVYHPAVTPWLAAARDRGASVLNGLGMLVHQAALQLEAWTGRPMPLEAMWEAVEVSGAAGSPGTAGSGGSGTGRGRPSGGRAGG